MTRVVLGLAHLTALELSPPALVTEAARAGFGSVGLRVVPATTGGPAYPTRLGTEAHRALKQILAAEGVRVSDIEFIQLTPEIDVRAFAAQFEAAADLGAISVTVSGDDHDPARLTAHFAELCDLALAFGLRVDLEFMRWRAIGALPQALSIVQQAGKSNGAILVDALHLTRSGGKAGDLISIPDEWLRAVQICDAGARRAHERGRHHRRGARRTAAARGRRAAARRPSGSAPRRRPPQRRDADAGAGDAGQIAAAFDATQSLLDRQSRGTMRPRQRRENSPTGYMT